MPFLMKAGGNFISRGAPSGFLDHGKKKGERRYNAPREGGKPAESSEGKKRRGHPTKKKKKSFLLGRGTLPGRGRERRKEEEVLLHSGGGGVLSSSWRGEPPEERKVLFHKWGGFPLKCVSFIQCSILKAKGYPFP